MNGEKEALEAQQPLARGSFHLNFVFKRNVVTNSIKNRLELTKHTQQEASIEKSHFQEGTWLFLVGWAHQRNEESYPSIVFFYKGLIVFLEDKMRSYLAWCATICLDWSFKHLNMKRSTTFKQSLKGKTNPLKLPAKDEESNENYLVRSNQVLIFSWIKPADWKQNVCLSAV